jgi:hypothetical protein
MLRLILTVLQMFPKELLLWGFHYSMSKENCFDGLGQNKADIIKKNNSGRHQR